MILYIGEKHHAFFLNDICSRLESLADGYEILDTTLNIKEIVAPATAKTYQHIMVNVTIFGNSAEEITTALLTIQNVTNANMIIEAQGLLPKSDLMIALYNAGFRNFIRTNLLSDKKEECMKCMTGYYDINPVPFEEELMSGAGEETGEKSKQEVSLESIRLAQKQKTEIGVAGCLSRIGTTTQALQIVKYLTLKGYKACYIEANQSGWILEYMSSRTEDEYRYMEQIGLVSYKEMDLYVNRQFIPMIKKKDYDFFVYDYGCYQEDTFERMSFLEKNIGIVVGGIKPRELEATDLVMNDTLTQNNVYYIFSFIDVDTSDKDDIIEMMEDKADHTSFAAYAANPFSYTSTRNGTYDKIFDLENRKRKDASESKRLFKWNRKKKERKEVV